MFSSQICRCVNFVSRFNIKNRFVVQRAHIARLSFSAHDVQNKKLKQFNGNYKRRHQSTSAKSKEIILTSPFGSVDIPDIPVHEYIFKDVEQWADKPAMTCGSSERTYSYGIFTMLIDRCAKAFLSTCKLKPGDTIALLLPNIPEYGICVFGALKAGLIVTFVNPLYTPDEIRRQFENADTKAIVTISLLLDVAKIVGPMLKDYKGTIHIGGEDEPDKNIFGLESLLTQEYDDVTLPQVKPEDIAILPYSSGTTGLPKGVELTHRNLVANLVQNHKKQLESHVPTSDTNQDIGLTVLPFFHIYGFNAILNLSLLAGTHIITLPRFVPEDYLKALVEFKPTMLYLVPSLVLFLATHPAVKKEHLQSVRTIISGGALASRSIIEKFNQKAQKEIDFRQGYGMTEASPVVLFIPVNSPKSKLGSIGQVYSGTEVKVVDLVTGETLGPDKAGELLIRGPQVMKGYWKNEKATKETIDSDGWLHSGDVVYYDEEGYFFIVDRTKELIKVKGNQVSPSELEALMLELPGVADVAVVGIPDELAGELPRAFVVRRPGVNPPLTEKDIIDYVHPKVVNYKRIKGGIHFIDAIPRNAAGKIIRNELKILGTK
ncbi:4-coumarate--CoA ligase-like [Chrysoperla carnea]|uniref:4-coumarate--CoA ligase-like n=1 Tax=Chrysoperla carnea TaxID=189513 RepID=UPI001D083678|nr:4-coumarate--CoA ligase-like [Chrysoperla carnea]